MKIKTDSGKYTFVSEIGDLGIQILRHGEPWVDVTRGSNAIRSLMAELDAARVVLKAARVALAASYTPFGLAQAQVILAVALEQHDGLVSDTEPPSDWAKASPTTVDDPNRCAICGGIVMSEASIDKGSVCRRGACFKYPEPDPSEWYAPERARSESERRFAAHTALQVEDD